MAIPVLLLAVLAASLFGGSTFNLALLLGLTRWPVVARLVRVEARALLSRDFVRAARALGATPMQIARRHVLPSAAAPAWAAAGIIFGGAVMAEAALAFVGLGDAAATSWGQLTATGFGFVGRAWWVWFWPAAMLVVVSACVALLADPRED
jgi:peptide/nickel transport system permease protein